MAKQLDLDLHGESTESPYDAFFTPSEGILTIDEMGLIGEFSHTETDEYMAVDSFIGKTAFLPTTIERLSEREKEER